MWLIRTPKEAVAERGRLSDARFNFNWGVSKIGGSLTFFPKIGGALPKIGGCLSKNIKTGGRLRKDTLRKGGQVKDTRPGGSPRNGFTPQHGARAPWAGP